MRAPLFALPLVGTLLLPAGEAHACSAPECTPGDVRPRAGQSVAASVPALLHRPTWRWRTEPDAGEVPPPVLVGPDGGEVALQRMTQGGWEEWAPTTALAPHTSYVFRYTETCVFSAEGGERVVEVPFRTLEATPLPTEAGRLVLLQEDVGPIGVMDRRQADSCGTGPDVMVEAATARVGFIPSAELSALLPVADVWAQVEGQGARMRPATLTERQQVPGLALVFTVFALCEHPDGGLLAETGLPEGTHTLQVFAHLPGGAPALAPLSQQVRLECTAAQPQAPQEPSGEEGGCTAATGATAGAALALLAALTRRRRMLPPAHD